MDNRLVVTQDEKIAGNDIKLGIPTKIPSKSGSGAKPLAQSSPLDQTQSPALPPPPVRPPVPRRAPTAALPPIDNTVVVPKPPTGGVVSAPKAPGTMVPEKGPDLRPPQSTRPPINEEIAGTPPKTITLKPKPPAGIPEEGLDNPPVSKQAWTVATRDEYKRPTSRTSAEPRGGVFTVNEGSKGSTTAPAPATPASGNDKTGKSIYDSRQASGSVSHDDSAVINEPAASASGPGVGKAPVGTEDVVIDFDSKPAAAPTAKHLPPLLEEAPLVDNKYDARVIVKLESDPVTDKAVQRLYDKHPDNSVIVERNAQGEHSLFIAASEGVPDSPVWDMRTWTKLPVSSDEILKPSLPKDKGHALKTSLPDAKDELESRDLYKGPGDVAIEAPNKSGLTQENGTHLIKKFSDSPLKSYSPYPEGVTKRITDFKSNSTKQPKKLLYVYQDGIGNGGVENADVVRSTKRIMMMADKGHDVYYAGVKSNEDMISAWNDIGIKTPSLDEVIFDTHGGLSPSQKYTPAIQMYPKNQFNLTSVDLLENKTVPTVKFYGCFGGFKHCDNFATKMLTKLPGVDEVFASDGVRIDNHHDYRWSKVYPSHALLSETSEFHNIKTWTNEGKLRYSRTPSGDITINSAHDFTAKPKLRVNAPEPLPSAGSKYDTRVIVKLESDPVTDRAAQRIHDKHPSNSVIIERNDQGQHIVVAGDPQRLGGTTKVELVGHGDTAPSGAKSLGGLDAHKLANEVMKVSGKGGQNAGLAVDVRKVTAVGCDTGVCTADGPSLVARLDESIKALGIKTAGPVKGYKGLVDVTEDGHKKPTDEGGLGKTRLDGTTAPVKEDIYVYLDKLPTTGSAPSPMYGNFSGLVRKPSLWHPSAGPEELKKLMGGGEYSGRLFLVGHGLSGRAVIESPIDEDYKIVGGKGMLKVLDESMPPEYVKKTESIYCLQCNSSLKKKGQPSLIDKIADQLTIEPGNWDGVSNVYGNKFLTRYQPSSLLLNARKPNGVWTSRGEVKTLAELRDAKLYDQRSPTKPAEPTPLNPGV
ncbi:C80 family cysteine peptidase [Pseudomonas sp. NPDC086251]|uniref:C80 family cysteine peptidase n=1 Tax=Pseudomonas sp. NPDC086251 TaxID=3364431 RepID=UPI003838E7A8